MGHAVGKAIVKDSITYIDTDQTWHKGTPNVMGPGHHGMWLSSVVFDGARAMAGRVPDLDLHCKRVINSARVLGLAPKLDGPEIEALVQDGIRQFPEDAELYICPMFFAESGFILPDPDSARFVLSIFDSPLPPPDGFSACLTRFRRPDPLSAPTEAKASCLYPNVARCSREAKDKGFERAIVLDPAGKVAEFDHSNLFMARDGVVHTPVHNATFLNGITRQRIIKLLQKNGTEVIERSIEFDELMEADELFETGNYCKVRPCTRIEDRDLQAGPLFSKARELYFDFAKAAE